MRALVTDVLIPIISNATQTMAIAAPSRFLDERIPFTAPTHCQSLFTFLPLDG
jgi:hypothetical protein